MSPDISIIPKDDSFVRKALILLDSQKRAWPLLRDNCDLLKMVKTREFDFDGFSIKAQFNPARIKSSAADVSANGVERRDCFLCIQNLPEEQKTLPLLQNYLLLCNPFPIFPEHFTIPNKTHNPQRIIGSFGSMLDISRLLGERLSLFYNGARCGASAPDHLHFQAATRNVMPLESDLEKLLARNIHTRLPFRSSEVYLLDDSLRRFMCLKSSSMDELKIIFNLVINSLQVPEEPNEEPMINILSVYSNDCWEIMIFPRRKHRPDQFYSHGSDQLIISPAIVDLAGLMIVPREEDFLRLTGPIVADILDQVVISKEAFAGFADKFRASSSQLR